jgi:hypothetical protein
MADRPDTDAALVRRVLGYAITEDGSSQAARQALGRLSARLSEAEALAEELNERWLGMRDCYDAEVLRGGKAEARLSEYEQALQEAEDVARAAIRWCRSSSDQEMAFARIVGVARAALSGSAGNKNPSDNEPRQEAEKESDSSAQDTNREWR